MDTAAYQNKSVESLNTWRNKPTLRHQQEVQMGTYFYVAIGEALST